MLSLVIAVGCDSRMIRHAVSGLPIAHTSSRVHAASTRDRSTATACRVLVEPAAHDPGGTSPVSRYCRHSARSWRFHRCSASGITNPEPVSGAAF